MNYISCKAYKAFGLKSGIWGLTYEKIPLSSTKSPMR